jgi:hypothetical protein
MQPGSAPAQASNTLQPVQLTPPVATAGSSLPDVSQVSGGQEEPVTLVPPSESGSSSPQMRYLPDSRYAARRTGTDSDSSN